MTSLINSLLELHEEDERRINFYLTGILQPLIKPYSNIIDSSKIEFAISEKKVKNLIKEIIKATRNPPNKLLKQ